MVTQSESTSADLLTTAIKHDENSNQILLTFIFAHGPLALAAGRVSITLVLLAEPHIQGLLHGWQEIGHIDALVVAHVATHAVRLAPARMRLRSHEVTLVIRKLSVPRSICRTKLQLAVILEKH